VKVFSDAALAAIEAGEAISVGAVYLGCTPAVALWGGYGDLVLTDADGAPMVLGGDGEPLVFKGVGDKGLVTVAAGQLGASAQKTTLSLSGVESEALAMFDAALLRGAPASIWRLLFNGTGSTLLDARVFTGGAVDQVALEATPGGTATITVTIEGAARTSQRRGGRVRSDADQRVIDPNDAGFSQTSFAGQKTLYWGGKRPEQARAALDAVHQVLDDIFH
jgi:hypothetical protein